MRYTALDSGKIDVASVFTTDSQLAADRYTLLADPEGVFEKQHVAPLISRKALAAHGPGAGRRRINAVSALLTTPVMRELNAQGGRRASRRRRRSPTTFLRAHGLTEVASRSLMSDTIRVAVCDDARAVKFFLRTVLEEDGDMRGRLDVQRRARGASRRCADARPTSCCSTSCCPTSRSRPTSCARSASAGRDGDPADVQPAAAQLEKEAERLATDGWTPKAHKPEQLRQSVRDIVAARA